MQSRYYNPEIGRFINADDTAYLGADGTLVSFNLFSYCKNSPVSIKDPTGTFGLFAAIVITGTVIGGLMGAFTAATTGGNILESTIEGCLTGMVGSLCGMLIANPLVAAGTAFVGGFTIDVATQCVSNRSVDMSEVDFTRSAKTGLLTGLGAAIPQFGNAATVAADAFGTALMWAEGSALITAADVAITNAISSRKEKTRNTTIQNTSGIYVNRYASKWSVY